MTPSAGFVINIPVGRHPGQKPCLHAEMRYSTQAWLSAAGISEILHAVVPDFNL